MFIPFIFSGKGKPFIFSPQLFSVTQKIKGQSAIGGKTKGCRNHFVNLPN